MKMMKDRNIIFSKNLNSRLHKELLQLNKKDKNNPIKCIEMCGDILQQNENNPYAYEKCSII